jgi:hypothetical protein
MNKDLEHLKLLTIFHYVLAGMMALFSCFPLIYLILGVAMISGVLPDSQGETKIAGMFFVLFAGIFILIGWTMAILVFIAGRNLARRVRYTYCLVIAGIQCLFMPVGTVLGVFTIIVLSRESVKALFTGQDSGSAAKEIEG